MDVVHHNVVQRGYDGADAHGDFGMLPLVASGNPVKLGPRLVDGHTRAHAADR
jgi:hypothetical protein